MTYIENLEKEARMTALKHVTNLLRRTDQLEKLEHYRKRELRKKLSVEGMLKTALQSHLDGIRIGMQELKQSITCVNDIKKNMEEIEKNFCCIPNLIKHLFMVQEEQLKYSQYAVAIQNLNHIFNVPEIISKIQKHIEEEKFLYAHHYLSELERSRNDMLLELYSLKQQKDTDIKVLSFCFSEVESLYDKLGKQLWLCFSRTLNIVRKQPTVIVTALRIVEREEKMDSLINKIQKETGFIPPGRPRKWRQKALSILKEAVNQRIEGCQCETRAENKMWLVKHLEVNRILMLEDLKVIKSIASFCFPPHYQIFKTYIKMYHESMRNHLKELIKEGLIGNELVTLLSWVLNVYTSSDLLKHPDLNINVSELDTVLEVKFIEKLKDQYLSNICANYTEWLKKTLEGEVNEWNASHLPEKDAEGYYHTAMPIIISNIMDQNLQVAATVNINVTQEVLLLSLNAIIGLCNDLLMQLKVYKNRYFMDRNQLQFFTQYIIAIGNNCQLLLKLIYLLLEKYLYQGVHNEHCKTKFEEVKITLTNMEKEIIHILLEEVFLDIEPHFSELLSKRSPQSNIPIDTIIVTLEDYFQDYIHLKLKLYQLIVWELQEKIVVKYVYFFLQKKFTFKDDERESLMNKVKEDSLKLKNFFIKVFPDIEISTCDVISDIADVVKVRDPELISLELHSLVNKYKDITPDQLIALLSMRGDISRFDIRQLVADIIPRKVQDSNNPFILGSVLSKLPPLSRTLFEINIS